MIHFYREVNQCADALAKLREQSFTHFVVFCNPQPMVETLLAFDKASMHCNRLVNSKFNIISPFTQKKFLLNFSLKNNEIAKSYRSHLVRDF